MTRHKKTPFHVPPCIDRSVACTTEAISLHGASGDGALTKRRNEWIERTTGTKILFAAIRPDIVETLIEAAITEKPHAIMPMHYAGVACETDTIMAVARSTDPTALLVRVPAPTRMLFPLSTGIIR